MEEGCPKCNAGYNEADKYKLLLPCGDNICLLCFEHLMGKDPATDKIVCPADQEEVMISKKFREKINILIEQKNQKLWILCKDHNEHIAEYLCPKERVLICYECAFSEHSDHAK
jgi:hypothetical protein